VPQLDRWGPKILITKNERFSLSEMNTMARAFAIQSLSWVWSSEKMEIHQISHPLARVDLEGAG
jgi:hypothetical protein